MPEEQGRELILAKGEQCALQDTTQGMIHLYVGPTQKNLDKTDRPVRWDDRRGRFVQCNLEESISRLSEAREGEYLVLLNPTDGDNSTIPQIGGNKRTPDLQMGRKINIQGPVELALWPGQSASVLPGHSLRTNQFVLCRVYNQHAAEENWDKAVVDIAKSIDPSELPGKNITEGEKRAKAQDNTTALQRPKSLAIGKTFVITGNDVAFYIPSTGIEVVPAKDENEHDCYIRDAITLECLEYCALLDENGKKRYVKGPNVVFPAPTEVFIKQDNGEIVASAIELNHLMGLYIKVTSDYTDDEKEFKAGDELFMKGNPDRTLIYYPRAEHAIICYGSEKIHFATAIPEGEARYVLDRNTGKIVMHKGPDMFLPDPRKQVIVRRSLSDSLVKLLYPGNQEALDYNRSLRSVADTEESFGSSVEKSYAAESTLRRLTRAFNVYNSVSEGEYFRTPCSSISPESIEGKKSESGFVGDKVKRRTGFTRPRTITLDAKYDGVPEINIWNGYAIMVTDKQGGRRVEMGPKTVLLDYDEEVEAMQLSTGKPKTTDNLLNTAYLRVFHNKVSDIILDAETSDFCSVQLKLSYRVNFEENGETHDEIEESRKRWFDVENYVKFLCDHMRSRLKNMIKRIGIEQFHSNATNLVRDCILGAQKEGEKRPGCYFPENSMRIYDVEVLKVDIGDKDISNMLVTEQHEVVRQRLQIDAKARNLELKKKDTEIETCILELNASQSETSMEIKRNENARIHEINMEKVAQVAMLDAKKVEDTLNLQKVNTEIIKGSVALEKVRSDYQNELMMLEVERKIKLLLAETKSSVERANAFSPEIVAALNSFSSRALAREACEALAPIAITHGQSIVEVFDSLVKGTVLNAGMSDLQTIADGLRKKEERLNKKNDD